MVVRTLCVERVRLKKFLLIVVVVRTVNFDESIQNKDCIFWQ